MPFDPAVSEILRLSLRADNDVPGGPTRSQLAQLVDILPPQRLNSLANATHFHGIAWYVYEALREVALPEDVRATLRHLRDRAAFVHLVTVADLEYLERTLDGASIPWMIIKGPTLAEPIHGAAQRRSYGDLDAIVPPTSLENALVALEAAGSTVTDRNWALIALEMKGEVHVQLPSGTRLDLHWHLFNEDDRRQLFPVSIPTLFQRSRIVTVAGRHVRTLSFADTVVYVAMHTMHSGGHRLIWLKDLERLLAHPQADADSIVETARAWKAELVLAASLQRVGRTLALPPSAIRIRSSLPHPWMWCTLTELAWRRCPAPREDGAGSVGRIVAGSIRRDSIESFAELARRAYAHLRGRLNHEMRSPGKLDPDDPRSDRYESGGAAARAEFLDEVRQFPT